MPPGAADTVNLISSGGLVAVLVIILFFGKRGDWVWGSQLKKAEADVEVMRKERDAERAEKNAWIERTMKAIDLATTSNQTTKAVVDKTGEK